MFNPNDVSHFQDVFMFEDIELSSVSWCLSVDNKIIQ
jgi:hypothetical protein